MPCTYGVSEHLVQSEFIKIEYRKRHILIKITFGSGQGRTIELDFIITEN